MFSDKYHAESISVQQRKDVNFRDDLRIGLLQREFFVVYQPVVDVASRIVG